MKKSKYLLAALLTLMCASVWAQKNAAYWQGKAVSLSDIVDGGEYYIYSPKYNMFLGRGNDWGTRATLDYQGLTWGITSAGSDTYTLENTSRDGHAHGYLFIDQDDESVGWVYTNTADLTKASTKWTIAPVDVTCDKLWHENESTALLDIVLTYDQQGKKYTFAIVNKDPSSDVELTIDFAGLGVKFPKRLTGTVLSGGSPDDYNDIEHPDRVIPEKKTFVVKDSKVCIPAHSLAMIDIEK